MKQRWESLSACASVLWYVHSYVHMAVFVCEWMFMSVCVVGHFKQGLPVKTLAALRSSQALMLKVCEDLPPPLKCVCMLQSCYKERPDKACPLTEPRGATQEPVTKLYTIMNRCSLCEVYSLTILFCGFIITWLVLKCTFPLKSVII